MNNQLSGSPLFRAQRQKYNGSDTDQCPVESQASVRRSQSDVSGYRPVPAPRRSCLSKSDYSGSTSSLCAPLSPGQSLTSSPLSSLVLPPLSPHVSPPVSPLLSPPASSNTRYKDISQRPPVPVPRTSSMLRARRGQDPPPPPPLHTKPSIAELQKSVDSEGNNSSDSECSDAGNDVVEDTIPPGSKPTWGNEFEPSAKEDSDDVDYYPDEDYENVTAVKSARQPSAKEVSNDIDYDPDEDYENVTTVKSARQPSAKEDRDDVDYDPDEDYENVTSARQPSAKEDSDDIDYDPDEDYENVTAVKSARQPSAKEVSDDIDYYPDEDYENMTAVKSARQPSPKEVSNDIDYDPDEDYENAAMWRGDTNSPCDTNRTCDNAGKDSSDSECFWDSSEFDSDPSDSDPFDRHPCKRHTSEASWTSTWALEQESLNVAAGAKPKSKLEHLVTELVSTEEDYVERLSLLVKFEVRVREENQKCQMFPSKVIDEMCMNIRPIYDFHHDSLLPELQQRLSEWETKPTLGDVLKPLVPFLKLTSEYVTNLEHARGVISHWKNRLTTFAKIISSVESDPASNRLSLFTHMLEPVQRVPRYKMLLEGYLKRLPEDSCDKKDIEDTLLIVREVACYSNREMRRRSNVRKVMKIKKSFSGNDIDGVVNAKSELIKDGRVFEISPVNGKQIARHMFLMNNVLLLGASRRNSSCTLIAKLSLECMQVSGKDSPGVFEVKSRQRVIELLASSPEEREVWIKAIRKTVAIHVNQHRSRAQIFAKRLQGLGLRAPTLLKQQEVTECMRCDKTFGITLQKCHCHACGHVVCKQCSKQKMPLVYDYNRMKHVCDNCCTMLQLRVSVKATDDSLCAGFLHTSSDAKTWRRRYFALHDDFVLYSFYNEDSYPMTSVPLHGCLLCMGSMGGMQMPDTDFKLVRVGETEIHFYRAEHMDDFERWTDVIQCAIEGKLLLCRSSRQDSMLTDTEC